MHSYIYAKLFTIMYLNFFVLSSHWWRFCFCAMTCKEIWTMVWKNLPINVERWKSARIWITVHNSWAISFPVAKFTTFGIQIFRLTSHNWKMEEHGLMLQLKSSLLIALASARCQPWDRTTDLITIVSGQLWNEIEVTHPSHNEVTQPLRNLPHVHKGWVN